ncbi:MAG: DUF3617 family protein [Casimicrobiaceae bacterium]|nr:hypothetical protein [Betaproteobacteria bacterium]
MRLTMRLTLLVLGTTLIFSPLASVAHAQEYPKLKAGQWEMTTNTPKAKDAASARAKVCLDDSVQQQMVGIGTGMRREMCSKWDLKRDGARYITESECKLGESKLTSRAVLTMQGDTGYKTEIRAAYDPPFMGMKDSTTTIEGKYTGPCRDGLQPGDLVTAEGHKINIRSLADRQPATPPKK